MKQFLFLLVVLILMAALYVIIVDGANPILCVLREAVGNVGCPDALSAH